MVRRTTVRPRSSAAAAAGAALLLVAVAGCTPTAVQSEEHASIEGASATVGTVSVRNALITLQPQDSADLDVAFSNSGPQADALTTVRVPAAGSVALPSSFRSTVVLPPSAVVFVNNSPDEISLRGLTGAPSLGQHLAVTFVFAAAGTLTLQVPIVGDLRGNPVASTAGSSANPSANPSVSATISAGSGPSQTVGPTTVTGSPTINPSVVGRPSAVPSLN